MKAKVSSPHTRRWALPALAPASVALTTWLLFVCQTDMARVEHLAYVRPYGIVFVAPVALLTALGGARLGFGTLALSAVALEYVLFAPHFSWRVAHPRDWVELVLLVLVGGLIVFTVEAARHNPRLSAEARESSARLQASEERRLAFSREVLLAVTGGRLLLCGGDELRGLVSGPPALTRPLREAADASALRRDLRGLVAERGLAGAVRVDDLLTGAAEAATNAVKHGREGQAQVWLGGDQVSVLVSDRGAGIRPQDLARATLEQGYSSQATLGMGYALMLQVADQVALSTSEAGTQVLLQVGGEALPTPQEQFLSLFPLRQAS